LKIYKVRYLLTDHDTINVIKSERDRISKQNIVVKQDINSFNRDTVNWIDKLCDERTGSPLGRW
jgi:hypothetical protein